MIRTAMKPGLPSDGCLKTRQAVTVIERHAAHLEKIDKAGAGIRSLTEHLDTTTPAGRMITQMFGSFAKFERSMIRERTRAWLRGTRVGVRAGIQ
jgi:hypothetical protein